MKVRIALFLSRTSNAQALIQATRYTTSMTGNILFLAADIVDQVLATIASIAALYSAMTAPASASKTDLIKVAREILDKNVIILASKVECLANSPTLADDNRIGIIHSAGMEVRIIGRPKKRAFRVENSDIEGLVRLIAQGGANAHEWQYTTDIIHYTGRVAITTTTKASTEVSGLTRGVRYAFFHKPIIPGVNTDWEGPIIITVL